MRYVVDAAKDYLYSQCRLCVSVGGLEQRAATFGLLPSWFGHRSKLIDLPYEIVENFVNVYLHFCRRLQKRAKQNK